MTQALIPDLQFVAADLGNRRGLPPEYHPNHWVVHLQRSLLGLGRTSGRSPIRTSEGFCVAHSQPYPQTKPQLDL